MFYLFSHFQLIFIQQTQGTITPDMNSIILLHFPGKDYLTVSNASVLTEKFLTHMLHIQFIRIDI